MTLQKKQRDLYIITYAPILGSGRAMRSFSCVKALAMLGPVDLAYVPHDSDAPSPEYQAIDNLEFHQIKPSRGLRRAATYVGNRLRGTPASCCRGTSPELIEIGERLASAPGRGRVVVDGGTAATALMPFARGHAVTYNSHNVEAARVGASLWSRLGMRRYERRLLNVAQESWMVSQADLAAAKRIAPGARLRYVPNVVDVSAIAPREAHRPAEDRSATLENGSASLLMVADFRYRPNVSGRDLLVDNVLPRVWLERPNTRLVLVGRGLEYWRSPDTRVEVAGFVEHLGSYYHDADCVVVPLIEGAGTPLKFIEALAYQAPIVATPFAAQGLDVAPGEHYLEGADAPALARGIIRVLSDGAQDIAREGRRLAEAEYSIEALAERIARPAAVATARGG
jgi:polysaccharide biosynthesis protein PslH